MVAHLANALPDLDDDVAAGVRGLPQRIGPGPTRATAAVLLLAAAVLLAVAPPGPVGLAGAGPAGRWPSWRCWWRSPVAGPTARTRPFALAVLAALAVVGLLLAHGTSLA